MLSKKVSNCHATFSTLKPALAVAEGVSQRLTTHIVSLAVTIQNPSLVLKKVILSYSSPMVKHSASPPPKPRASGNPLHRPQRSMDSTVSTGSGEFYDFNRSFLS